MADRVFEGSPMFFYSHMPFLCYWNGMKVLLFCYSIAENCDKVGYYYNKHRRWKLAFYNFPYDELQFFPVPDEGEEDIVCSPEMYLNTNNQYILTYSIGRRRYGMPPQYQLCSANADQMMGFYYSGYTGLLKEPRPIILRDQPVWNGFEHNDLLVFQGQGTDSGGRINVRSTDGILKWTLMSSFSKVLRTSYMFEDQHRLLFTGYFNDDQSFRTYVYNWDSKTIEGELLVEGQPVYKSTILGSECMFAYREPSNEFEERHIMVSEDWEIATPTHPFTVDIV